MTISIVPEPRQCRDCGREMHDTWTYDAAQYAWVSSWECPGCDRVVRRAIEGEVRLRRSKPLRRGKKRRLLMRAIDRVLR